MATAKKTKRELTRLTVLEVEIKDYSSSSFLSLVKILSKILHIRAKIINLSESWTIIIINYKDLKYCLLLIMHAVYKCYIIIPEIPCMYSMHVHGCLNLMLELKF